MKLKHIYLVLGICCLFVMLLMSWLYASSTLAGDPYRSSFSRNIMPVSYLHKVADVDLGKGSFYIAGASEAEIFLGDQTRPLSVVIINRANLNKTNVRIAIPELDTIYDPGYIKLNIQGEQFFLTHGVMPFILRGKVGDWKAKRLKLPPVYFDQIIPVADNVFAVRAFSRSQNGYALAKLTTTDDPDFQFNYSLLEGQTENVFSVDGILNFDPGTNKVNYIYRYRNQFVLADTSLRIISRGETIDTFRNAQIKITRIESQTGSMIASPAATINKDAYVFNDRLFVESNLLAKNESMANFEKYSILDEYDLLENSYVRSFYVPVDDEEKISDFSIRKGELLALEEGKLTIFTLP